MRLVQYMSAGRAFVHRPTEVTYGQRKSLLRPLDRQIRCHELPWQEASFQQNCSRRGPNIREGYLGVTLLILLRNQSKVQRPLEMHLLPTLYHWAQHKRACHVYPDLFVAARALKLIVALTRPFLRRRNIRFLPLRSNFFRLRSRRVFEEVVKTFYSAC